MSVSLEKFKQDFDALANSLPKKSIAPKKDEEAEKAANQAAEALFQENFSAFQSQYAGQVDELKTQLRAKRFSPVDTTDLEITAEKISSLEQIAKLGVDKAGEIKKALSLPYQKSIDSRLEAKMDLPPGLMGNAEGVFTVKELLEKIWGELPPDAFGITTPLFGVTTPLSLTALEKPSNRRPVKTENMTIKLVNEGTVVVQEALGRDHPNGSGISYLYNVKGEFIRTLNKEGGIPVSCENIEISANGQFIIAKEDKTGIVRLYDAKGKHILLLDEQGRPILCNEIKISANGQFIIARQSGKEGIQRLYDANGELIPLLNGEREPVFFDDIKILKDKETVVARELDTGSVYLYEKEKLITILTKEKGKNMFRCKDIKISANGQFFTASEWDPGRQKITIRLYNAKGELIPLLDEQEQPVLCDDIKISANGQFITAYQRSSKGDTIARPYNANGELILLRDEKKQPILCIRINFSANGQFFTASEWDPVRQKITIRPYNAKGELIPLLDEQGQPIVCNEIEISANGQLVIAHQINPDGRYKATRLYNAEGKFIPLLDEQKQPILYSEIKISDDGKTFAAGLNDSSFIINYLRLYTAEGKLIPLLDEQEQPILCSEIKISANGRFITAYQITPTGDTTTRLYTAEGKLIPFLNEQGQVIPYADIRIEISANDQFIIASEHGLNNRHITTRLYNAKGELIPLLDEKGQVIPCNRGIEISADGQFITTGYMGTRLYNAEGKLISLLDERGQPISLGQVRIRFPEGGGEFMFAYGHESGHYRGGFYIVYSGQKLFEQMVKKLSVEQFTLIRWLEEIKKDFKAQNPEAPFSTSPIEIAYSILHGKRLTSEDFAPENIQQTQALCKQVCEWVSEALETKKDEVLIPEVGTYRDYLKKTYALEEKDSPKKTGGLPPYLAVCHRLKKAVEERAVAPPAASQPDVAPVSAPAAAAVSIGTPIGTEAAPASHKEVNPPLPASQPDAAPVSAPAAATVRIEAPVDATEATPAGPKETKPPLPASNPDAAPVSRFARVAAIFKVLGKILIGFGFLINVPRLIRILTSWIKKR